VLECYVLSEGIELGWSCVI